MKFLKTLAIISVIMAFPAIAVSADKPLFGGGNSKSPIEIDADSLEVFQEQKKAIFSGNVVAKQGTMVVKSSKMKVYYSGGTGDGNSISKIDLDGNVFLSTPTESARAQKGVYDTKRDFVSLIGDVTLTRDKNVLKGEKLDFDIKAGHSKLVKSETPTAGSGRVRGLFIPE